MATIDLTSGNPVITPAQGQAPISLGSMAPTQQATGTPYDIFVSNISNMLGHAQQINATNNEALLGQRNALETQSVAGPQGPQAANPEIWSQDQDKIRQGWAAATAPAVTSLTDQMNANTANLGAISNIAGTFADKLKPTALSPGQSLVTPGGTVVIQGTEYTAVPDVTNPGQYKLMPTNSLGAPGANGSAGSAGAAKNPVAKALNDYNGGADSAYSDKVLGIYNTINKTYPNPSADTLDEYIAGHRATSGGLNGQQIMQVASHYGLDPNMIAAQLALETNFNTTGEATKGNNNPGGILFVGQAGATRGSARPAEEGGYYAAYKTPFDGLYAYGALMKQKLDGAQSAPATAPGASSTSSLSMGTQADNYSNDVITGKRSYADAVDGMGLYGAAGKVILDNLIRTAKPDFNFAQANTLAAQQGAIGPNLEYAHAALENLATATSKLSIWGQQSNIPILGGLANWYSIQSGQGKQQTSTKAGAVGEAQQAIASVLAAIKGGTPTEYGSQAKALLPDNPTPADIEAAKTNLTALGNTKQGIFGTPGGAGAGATAKGTMSDRDYVEKVLSGQGMKYEDVVGKLPAGYIGAIDNATGTLVQMLPSDFNASKYTHI